MSEYLKLLHEQHITLIVNTYRCKFVILSQVLIEIFDFSLTIGLYFQRLVNKFVYTYVTPRWRKQHIDLIPKFIISTAYSESLQISSLLKPSSPTSRLLYR